MRLGVQRVLVIDDDEVALELLASSIEAAGFDVLRRRSAPPIHEVKRLDLAAVVCDLVMDGMDGDRVLSSFQCQAELRDVPFILVSADAFRLEQALERMPWLHCVRKEGSLANLLDTLEELVERRAQTGKRQRAEQSSRPPRAGSSAPRALSNAPRELARQRFYELLHEHLVALRPYLIGGVLGPRAHAEVQKRMHRLRAEAAATMLSGSLDEALELCERLTASAQRDLRAMELLGSCTSWLAEAGAAGSFPLTLEGVPALRAAKSYFA
jgi:CheY-like chemotaxis protein